MSFYILYIHILYVCRIDNILRYISTAGRITPPKDGHVLISGTLHGKRDFADVIKVKDLEMEKLCWVSQVGLI